MLHVILSTEGLHVLGVLGDFHLLDGPTEEGNIMDTVLAHNSDLLGHNFSLMVWIQKARNVLF